MSATSRRVLAEVLGSYPSIYRVEEVHRGEGLTLQDIFTEKSWRVTDRRASLGAEQWDLLCCRLLHLDGRLRLSSAVISLPPDRLGWIRDELQKEYDAFTEFEGAVGYDRFLKDEGPILAGVVCNLCFPGRPTTVTGDGEAALFSNAHYEVRDAARVERALDGLDDLDRDEEATRWVWLGEQILGSGRRILGFLRLDGSRLVLECMSRSRLERGRAIVEGACGDALSHLRDTFADPLRAAEEQRGSALPPGPLSSLEMTPELWEIQKKLMDETYRNWADEPIPALKDETPREAARTPEGRRRVIDLLRSYEKGELRSGRPPEYRYDFSWMWEELGIRRE